MYAYILNARFLLCTRASILFHMLFVLPGMILSWVMNMDRVKKHYISEINFRQYMGLYFIAYGYISIANTILLFLANTSIQYQYAVSCII